MTVSYQNGIPDKNEFYELYETTGWNARHQFSKNDLFKAINNSWYVISVYYNEKLIGFGRVISDGVYQTFIGDLIVHPNYQGKGIGSEVLKRLIDQCKENGMKWIQLTCAQGKVEFYKKFGFEERPTDGPGMQKFI